MILIQAISVSSGVTVSKPMKLIPLKCDSCGGPLKRVRRDTVLCRHCSTAYLIGANPSEPINIPQSEPEPPPQPEYVPCEREQAVRKRIADSEYRFWQSLPERPRVKKKRTGRLIVDTEPHLRVPGAAMAIGMLVGGIALAAESQTTGYFAATVFAIGAAFAIKRLLDVKRTDSLIDRFVKEQTAMWKEIRNIRGEIELRQRLP